MAEAQWKQDVPPTYDFLDPADRTLQAQATQVQGFDHWLRLIEAAELNPAAIPPPMPDLIVTAADNASIAFFVGCLGKKQRFETLIVHDDGNSSEALESEEDEDHENFPDMIDVTVMVLERMSQDTFRLQGRASE